MAKFSEEKPRRYVTDEQRVYEVVVERTKYVSLQDIGTDRYKTIPISEYNDPTLWRWLDPSIIATAA